MKRKALTFTSKIIFFFFILLVLTNCSFKDYAPRTIKGCEIQIITTKASEVDERYLKNISVYSFKQNGTYTLTLAGKLDEAGDYSYVRKGRNRGDIVLTYNDPNGESSYGLDLTFINSNMGTWTDHYSAPNYITEVGTFTIVKRDHPYNQ